MIWIIFKDSSDAELELFPRNLAQFSLQVFSIEWNKSSHSKTRAFVITSYWSWEDGIHFNKYIPTPPPLTSWMANNLFMALLWLLYLCFIYVNWNTILLILSNWDETFSTISQKNLMTTRKLKWKCIIAITSFTTKWKGENGKQWWLLCLNNF